MQTSNRLNTETVIAALKNGERVDIGAADFADRVRLRRHCRKAGFDVAIVKVDAFSYVASLK